MSHPPGHLKRHFTEYTESKHEEEDEPPRKVPPIPPTISHIRPPLTRIPPPPPSIRPPIFGAKPKSFTPRPPSVPPPSVPRPQSSINERTMASASKALLKPKKQFGFAIKLGTSGSSKTSEEKDLTVQKKPSIAAVFNNDDSSDEEEMPLEAKMRMRNVGRETITSSGPNSFGKTKKGFTDTNKLFERKLQDAMDEVCNDKK